MSVQVEELEEKCEQAMMLKFGRIVDIDTLGTVTVSRAVEEARLTVQARVENFSKIFRFLSNISSREQNLSKISTCDEIFLNII